MKWGNSEGEDLSSIMTWSRTCCGRSEYYTFSKYISCQIWTNLDKFELIFEYSGTEQETKSVGKCPQYAVTSPRDDTG